MSAPISTIAEIGKHEGQSVTIRGWLYNLRESGKLLYSQKSGEFEAMRRMESSSVTSFLVQWKPKKEGCSAVMVNC